MVSRFLIRLYPRAWRERYGDELLALLQAKPPGTRDRLDLVRGALAERFCGGPQLIVLRGWAVFVLGGIGFQKTSEHWQAAMQPAASTRVPTIAFNVVQGAALAGSVAVMLGVLATIPTLITYLRAGGWPDIRRPILAAAFFSGFTVAALVALSLMHTVDAAALFVAGSVAALASWTHAAVVIARRLPLPDTTARNETLLAYFVAAMMVVMAVAAAVWMLAIWSDTSGFLGANVAVVACFMLVGTIIGGVGTVARSPESDSAS